jgi:hypothetical protein
MSVWIRQVRALLAAFLLVFFVGCGGDVTWSSSELRSEDGYWTAKAHITEYSGFGTGAVETTVEIERTNRGWGESPEPVLGFANDAEAIALKMRWDGPRHLVVVYNADPKLLYFQVSIFPFRISQRPCSRAHLLQRVKRPDNSSGIYRSCKACRQCLKIHFK